MNSPSYHLIRKDQKGVHEGRDPTSIEQKDQKRGEDRGLCELILS